MLKPELQDMETFVEGMETILAAHREVAQNYFADGSIEQACPPLRALLHIMAHGEYEGKSIEDPELRAMFSREGMLASDWYQERLKSQQEHDVHAWNQHVEYLQQFLEKESHRTIAGELQLEERLRAAKDRLEHVSLPKYQKELCGSIGRQPID